MTGEFAQILASAGMSIAVTAVVAGFAVCWFIYAYYKRRLAAIVGDEQDVANLAARRTQLQAQIDQLMKWEEDNKEELQKLQAEREEQERLRQDLTQAEIALSDQQNRTDELRKDVLESQQALTTLTDNQKKINQEIAETVTRQSDVKKELEQSVAERNKWKARSEEEAEKSKTLQAKTKEQESGLANLKTEISAAEDRKNRSSAEVEALAVRRDAIQAEMQRLNSELDLARNKLASVREDFAPHQDKLNERIRLETEIRTIEGYKTKLEEQVQKLEEQVRNLEEQSSNLTSDPEEEQRNERFATLLAEEPLCVAETLFPDGPLGGVSETEALDNLEKHLAAQNLFFPGRVVRAFHTCLKVNEINPLTVLAGVSGTGKTELPLRYAEAMGIHRLTLSVQPSWSSPQDLFGFYNYLEKRYVATDLIRALVRFDPYNFEETQKATSDVAFRSRADRLFLVLVDEMNLARVEYYFSEFLSKLELRRAVVDPSVRDQRAVAEIEIEGVQKDGVDDGRSARVWVGNNVLFVGTMNEDESTQTLSDKVLDRANVIRFARPPQKTENRAGEQRKTDYVRNAFLPEETWHSWQKPPSPESRWRKPVDDWIETLNEALGLIGRPFGWRVKDAIRAYIANYPGVEGGDVFRTAMADQIEQKVIPKLRGVDLANAHSVQALGRIEEILEELKDEQLLDVLRECRGETEYGVFNWRGVTRDD